VEEQRVQRRLAAILAADVVGYSRLTGVDEEGTIARLKALRRELIDPAIASHRGRIVKTTGDGMLIEFASVVDAVRCAVELQRGIASRNGDIPPDERIEFRVGVHLGDVVVEGDDLLGDGVNVAARLEGIAEAGAICLSGDAYRQVKGRIDLPVRDLGEQRLKNIAEPIRVYAVPPTSAQPMASVAVPGAHTPRLSIVVLPFANLGGDKEQDYFVDGITESLTTDLSRMSGAFVIARNTAFTYKGKAVDARQIGRELGVRYVMEGSVQSGRDRIRVNAQLIDAETGAHLWAERFDKPRADLFDMQDEITARLARTIGVELVAAEGRRAERERPNNMDAVDLTMRGWAIMNQPFSVDHARQARSLFEAALRLDDCNVDALIGLAYFHITVVRVFTLTNRDEEMRVADAAIAKALTLAPNNAFAHLVRGMLLHISRAPEAALREAELAVKLDRNLAWAHVELGFAKAMLGRAEETEAHIAEAMRLSPRDPALDRWYTLLGFASLYKGSLDHAVECLRNAVQINPKLALPFFALAAALALTGRDAEAAATCLSGRRLDPSFSVARFIQDRRSDNSVFLAQRERVYEGMRKAGVPEE
jgi:TolB-like protein/class 3 adenylate cyclase